MQMMIPEETMTKDPMQEIAADLPAATEKMPELTPEQLQDFIETAEEGVVTRVDLEGMVLSNG